MFKSIVAALMLINSSVATKNYVADISPEGACFVGKTCYVAIKTLPVGDMHINLLYPTRFKLGDYPAFSYENPVVTKDGGSVTESSIDLKVPFMPKSCGTIQVGGTLYFSVCDGSSCHLEHLSLETSVLVR